MTLQDFYDVVQTTLGADVTTQDMSSSELTVVIGTDTITGTYSTSTDEVNLTVNSKPTETSQV